MDVDIKTGTIFYKTEKAFDSGNKIIVHRGGTGSGKTYDLVLFLFSIALRFKDLIITIVSESKPHLDIGAIRILSNVCKPLGLWGKSNWNISTSRWTSPTGSIIEFFSADRIDKALGARRDYLYGNEVNSLKKDVWDELARRSENVIADFNPTAQFWMENWLSNYDKTVVIKSNYTDNPFLPETERNRIEMRVSRDENFKRIHFDCEYGVTEGIIFSNWYQIDKIPESLEEKAIYGLDFGFTNDPTALIKTIETDDAFYFDELIYQTGMLNSDIIRRFDNLGLRKNYDEIIADSAEPKSIQELCNAGYNVKKAVKGPDSIIKGLDTLLSKPIYATKRSTNLIKEFRAYSWALNKDGHPTNKPIDEYNHCFVGETLIETINGSKRIDEIKVGDLVLTSNGYKPVSKFFDNGCDKVLHMSISFRNLVVNIKATANHKIKTTKGWKQLKDLKTGDVLYTLKKSNLKDNFSTETCTINTQAKDISLKEQDIYTETYGSTTMEKYLRDITSTTLTETDITTISKTSNACAGANTLVCTSKKDCHATKKCKKQEIGWIMQEYMHQNGMAQKRVGRGIGSNMKNRWGLEKKQSLNASNVKTNLKPLQGNLIDSVQTNVNQNGEETQVLMTLKENASSVRLNSKPTNTAKQKCVVKNVVECIEVKNVSKENVFDIEVKDMHEYFANGILVHNCIDAIRYAVMQKINRFDYAIC